MNGASRWLDAAACPAGTIASNASASAVIRFSTGLMLMSPFVLVSEGSERLRGARGLVVQRGCRLRARQREDGRAVADQTAVGNEGVERAPRVLEAARRLGV